MKRIKSYGVFESKESVEDICYKYGIWHYTLNDDGTIDVDGNVNLVDKGLKELPVKFGRVNGYFNCGFNKLTSLEGSPNWVGSNFLCHKNRLTSLLGGPIEVEGGFLCNDNRLTSLEGCPERVYGDRQRRIGIDCVGNKIVSLEYYPKVLTLGLSTCRNPIYEIWKNVYEYMPNNHGHYLDLFDLYGPIQFEDGKWVCYRFRLDRFFEEIGVPKPPKLKNYKEV